MGVALQHLPGAGDHVLLHQRLGHAHGVDGVRRLIRGEEYRLLHPVGDAGGDDVVRPQDVGFHRLHGVKLAGGYLLQRRGVEHVVYPAKGADDGGVVPHVPDVEPELLRICRKRLLIGMTHIVLLLLVPGENAYLPNIRRQEPMQDGVAEGTGSASDEQDPMAE